MSLDKAIQHGKEKRGGKMSKIKFDYVEICAIFALMLLAFGLGLFVGLRYGTKFCPECGARYTSYVTYCHYDGTELIERKK